MKRFAEFLGPLVCLGVLLSAELFFYQPVMSAGAADNTISADFRIGADEPLIKTKFNLFNVSKRTTADFDRDIRLLKELSAQTVRTDLWLGETSERTAGAVGGTVDHLTYDYSQIDRQYKALMRYGITPYVGFSYNPYPLQVLSPSCANGSYSCTSDLPARLDVWQKIVKTIAAHLKAVEIPLWVGEVWNEPDGGIFFHGSLSDYEKLYAATVAGIREGNPDFPVGGPVIAWNPGFNESFLQYVNDHHLPLNVNSFHGTWPGTAHTIASQLSQYPAFNTTTMSEDEFGTYPCCNYPPGGPQDHYAAAAQLLHVFYQVLDYPALTSISWSQFQDECSSTQPGCYDPSIGLITFDGHRKASFNAFKIYSMMPVDRKQVTVSGAPLEAMASSDQHRASLVAINQTGSDQSTTVTLKHVPFAKGTVTVYRIDATHASYFDNNASENLTPVQSYKNVKTTNWSWTGTIPNNGTLYFQVDDGSGLSGLSALTPKHVARVINVNHYYPSRTTDAYSDFDPHTWIARQGMGSNRSADQEVGVTAERLPSSLNFQAQIDGTLVHNDRNSCACVRIDYVVNGAYTKSVLFHGPYGKSADPYRGGRNNPFPFGTKKQANQVIVVPNLAHFQVNLSQYAPSGWSGRVQITYIFQNVGNHTRWVVTTRAA
jgi:hypothetical protein